MPTLLGSEESFRRRFGSAQQEALAALSQLVPPFVLRRSKAAVAKELPARTDLEVIVPLSAEERALYDDVRLAAMADLGDVMINTLTTAPTPAGGVGASTVASSAATSVAGGSSASVASRQCWAG